MPRPLPEGYEFKQKQDYYDERKKHLILGMKCATCGSSFYDDLEWIEVNWHDGEHNYSGTYCDIECLTGGG